MQQISNQCIKSHWSYSYKKGVCKPRQMDETINYRRKPFFKGYKFHVCEDRGKDFQESTLVSSLQSAIRVMIEFLLIFGVINFVEVPKIHEIHKICSPQKKAPYVRQPSLYWKKWLKNCQMLFANTKKAILNTSKNSLPYVWIFLAFTSTNFLLKMVGWMVQ